MLNKIGKFLIVFGLVGLSYNIVITTSFESVFESIPKPLFITMLLIPIISFCLSFSFIYYNSLPQKRKKVIRVISIVSCIILFFGLFSKGMHWAGASAEAIISIFLFSFGCLPLIIKSRYEKRKSIISKTALRLSIVDLLAILFLCLGALFKFMHWPGWLFLTIPGCILLVISIFGWNVSFRKEVNLRQEAEEKLKESLKNLEILNTISNEITSTLNLNSVMNLIYQNISKLMDAPFFIIGSYHSDEENVSVRYCVKEGQIAPVEFNRIPVNHSNSYMALAIKNKKEIIINDEEKERDQYLSGRPQLHGKEDIYTNSLIFIPLIIQEDVIGLFSVQSTIKQVYSNSNIALLRSLAPVIAVALNNANAYNKINAANALVEEQKKAVEEKQKEILDSIRYAKRIQQALLPTEKFIERNVNKLKK